MSNDNQLNIAISEKASIAATLGAFDEDIFIDALYNDISIIISDLERTADKYYCEDEDKITNTLAMALRIKGYDATEQTKSNGDVDLTVRDIANKFYWIAEAKRGNSFNGVFEGVLQLLTRYLTEQKNAGFLIYYQKLGCLSFFDDWHTYLHEGKFLNYKGIEDCIDECKHYFKIEKQFPPLPEDSKIFDYVATKKNGGKVKIRHFITNLHHKPLDKSGRNNASLASGQAKLKIIEACDAWRHENKCQYDFADFFELLKKAHPEYFQ